MGMLLKLSLLSVLITIISLECVSCYSSNILVGEFNHPAFYNQSLTISAVHRPWYKRLFSFIFRSKPQIRNVTYEFPPHTVSIITV